MQIRSEFSIHQGDDFIDISERIEKAYNCLIRTIKGFYPESNVLIKNINITVEGKKKKPKYIAVVIYDIFQISEEASKNYDKYKELSKSKESAIEGTIKKVLEENPKTKIGFMKSLEKEGWISGNRI